MNRDEATIWNACLDIIQKNVNPQSFKTWFEPIKAIKYEEDVLTIQVPNKFFYEWI
ncbi:MAG TPA: DnaA N-terminal domain-containing protein, partial [Saprospiraceae bacterium]|nr:DnaA N-terminal domain-containing protein [Saprospiraceae bacterium]